MHHLTAACCIRETSSTGVSAGEAKDGQKQTYLAAWIDDATRFVVGARFTAARRSTSSKIRSKKPSLPTESRRPSTWTTASSIGVIGCKQLVPNLVSNWRRSRCHPGSKGKIETFNRRLDSFLAEIALQKPGSLEELNHYLAVWLKEKYRKDPHAGLSGISPETACSTDKRPLCFQILRLAGKLSCIQRPGKWTRPAASVLTDRNTRLG